MLAIGNDVYCDTALIANALERRFPPSQGYPSLFPPRTGGGKADTGLAKAVATYWNDRIVFPLIAQSLPYSRFDEKFMADRAQVSLLSINSEQWTDDMLSSGRAARSTSRG